jgi:uncharacterized membrane protein (DUF373 family)
LNTAGKRRLRLGSSTRLIASMESRHTERLLGLAKIPVYFVIVVIMLSTFFGSAHLGMLFFKELLNDEPYKYIINVDELLGLFSSALTIVVGYELVKALIYLVRSHNIPVQTIIKIAIIALMNKVITTDYSHIDYAKIISVAILILALGVTHFLFNSSSTDKAGS